MISTTSEKLTVSLVDFLKKIDEHCCTLSKTQQPFGLCIVTPKSAYVQPPTEKIRDELEKRVREYFKEKPLKGIYLKYFPPPLMPAPEEKIPFKSISLDDYQLSFQVPQFDNKWQQTVIARNLIYCPLNPEPYEYLDWFELQEEAIRLVPLVHQTVKELEIQAKIQLSLQLPAMPVFESFIFDYGLIDQHQPMSKEERKKWTSKEMEWKDRYQLSFSLVQSAKTVHDLYVISRGKAVSSRNPMLKALFWVFVGHIEKNLIISTQLPEIIKNHLLDNLRQTKKRTTKGKYVAKKRPAICVSDIECGQILYLMISDYLNSRNNALVEAVFFVWIAQHGAFSGHHLTVDSILSIKTTDINFDEMTIQVNAKEVYLTDGLNQMISDWIDSTERNKDNRVFQ